VDVTGQVLSTFTDGLLPWHLSLDSERHVLVADFWNHSILLLSIELQLQRVLIDTNSQVKLRRPSQLCYNELAAELYVAHSSEDGFWNSNFVSVYSLH